MMGEELTASDVIERGLIGDRAYALIDRETGKLASPKHPRKWAGLFGFSATFTESPRVGCPTPPVRIVFPDASHHASTEAGLDRTLSDALGRTVIFAASAPVAATFEEVWPAVKGFQLYGRVQPAKGEE